MYEMIRTVTTHPVMSEGFTKGWPAIFGWTGPNKNDLFKLFSFQNVSRYKHTLYFEWHPKLGTERKSTQVNQKALKKSCL